MVRLAPYTGMVKARFVIRLIKKFRKKGALSFGQRAFSLSQMSS